MLKPKDNGQVPLRLEYLDPKDLADNPSNWRLHPKSQTQALKDVVAEVGFAGALLYNETTGRLIDGHARKSLFKGQKVPVLIGSWTEDQERKILVTLDPLSAMAAPNQDALLSLLQSVEFSSKAVNDLLEALANGENGAMPFPDLPEGEKGTIGQMTFTISEDQRVVIGKALKLAKSKGGIIGGVNENSNGNALAQICETYITAVNG